MVHQGKVLKKQIENKGLTHAQAADLIKLSRSGLNLLFKDVELSEKNLDKAVTLLGIPREFFFSNATHSNAAAEPTAPYGALSPDNGPSCWQLLAEARQEIINLQRQLIEMSRPSVNAPMGKTKGQPV